MDLLYPPRRRPDQPRPRSKARRQAAVAVAMLATCAVLFAAFEPGGPLGSPEPPEFVRNVSLVSVSASVQWLKTSASDDALAADPLVLPHCSDGHFHEGALHYYGGRFGGALNRSVDWYLVVDYVDPDSTFSGLGSDTALYEFTKEVTVNAAMNRTHPLYTFKRDRPLAIFPANGTTAGDHAFGSRYTVAGWSYPLHGSGGNGTFLVQETHRWSFTKSVPLYQHEAAPCI